MFTNYNWDIAFANFKDSLQVMGFGMLGIFVVIGVLCGVVFLLSKVPEKKEKD